MSEDQECYAARVANDSHLPERRPRRLERGRNLGMHTLSLVRPERSAHAAIRGYLYQTCLGVLRWLDLEDDEILVVEGDEDLDRLLRDGTGISEQVKAYTGRLGARDRAVRDSLRAFAVTYAALRRDDAGRRFVFTTTAEKRRPRPGTLDVVAAWDDPSQREELIAELRRLLPKEEDEHVDGALAWLDAGPGRWSGFVDAVEWRFEADSLDGVRGRIEDRLRARGLVPTVAHIDRLLAELLDASAQADVARRRRTTEDLDELLRTTDEELARWSATPRAVALRAVIDEVAELGRLLRDGTRELRPDPSPGHLLTAAHEVVPFHTELRRAELEALADWCGGKARAGVWLWTGEGGSGKTRLMIEWCRQLRAQGWHAGFLHRYLTTDVSRVVVGKAPRLVVVDYAETRQDIVCQLLYQAATAPSGPPCRVVLLARREADWWRILGQDDADVEQLIAASPAPQRLEALDVGSVEAFREATAAFSEATRHAGDEASGPLLRKAVPRAITALTLAGGAAGDRVAHLLGAATEGLAIRDDLRATLDDLLLRPLYGAAERIEGLEPDLLGEELVASCLADEPALLDRVLEVADDDGLASALTVLTRLASRRPEERRWLERAFAERLEELAEPALAVAVEVGDPVGHVLASFAGEVSEALAERLMKRCDRQDYWLSVPLREVACEVTQRRLEVCQESWPEPSEEQLWELWRITMALGVRLGALGRPEEALKATRKAVERMRRLVVARPEAFLPDLATSLNNLGNRLSEIGRPEQALDAMREAVEIRRRLARSQSEDSLPDLAQNLSNFGVLLSNLGRPERALEASREAVAIRRRLAASRPEDFLPDLAQSLNNLGSDLTDLGQREEALEAIREAVKIRRRLVASRSDIFLPDLAASLDILGVVLKALERRKEALEATREAVTIDRQLAAARPDAFLPNLAMSLNNLGNRLSDLGRRKQALKATAESVDIRRRLAAAQPDVFLPGLANSLSSLGNRLNDLGRYEEALEAATEAVRTLAPFFERLPQAFAERMRDFVSSYRQQADDAGRPVDGELLEPILAELERLGEDS